MPTLNLLSLSAFALVVLAASGCPPIDAPCTVDDDCAFGRICVEGSCGIANSDGGSGSRRIGGGRGGVPPVVNVPGPISMFQPGSIGALGVVAQQPAGTALLGIYEPGSGPGRRDQVLFFNVASGELPQRPELGDGVDFRDKVNFGEDCNLDHASVERGFRFDGEDEVWFSCKEIGLVQARGSDFQNFITPMPGVEGADHVVAFGADPIDPQILQRRMFARRGSSSLRILRAEQGQDAATVRDFDALDARLRFGEIVGLFKIAEMDPNRDLGDLVLVFDRASPLADNKPALVPIERPFAGNTRTWVPARLPWRVIRLPEPTHAVRIGAVPDPRNLVLGDDNVIVNLTVFLPTIGQVAFGRLERTILEQGGTFTPGDFGFRSLRIDRQGGLPLAVPPSRDRILIADVPGVPDTVFYVMTRDLIGWRLPLHRTVEDDFTDDVRGANIDRSGESTAVGLIPFPSADQAWIAYTGAVDQILRVTFNL